MALIIVGFDGIVVSGGGGGDGGARACMRAHVHRHVYRKQASVGSDITADALSVVVEKRERDASKDEKR